MKCLLRTFPIIALATFVSLADAQTSVGTTEGIVGADQPLNLSLPRSDTSNVNWDRPDSNSVRRGEDSRSIAGDGRGEKDAATDRQPANRRAAGLPYGSGFEARQGSRTGGRGMGRGR